MRYLPLLSPFCRFRKLRHKMMPVVDMERHCPSMDFLPSCLYLSVSLWPASAIEFEVRFFPGKPALGQGIKAQLSWANMRQF